MSFAALLLELALTRLFSVVLFYHFAFLAISIALLGLGAGAVFAFLLRMWLERWTIQELGGALCSLNALIMVGVLEVVLHSAVSMYPTWLNFQRLTVLYLTSAVPFFVTGLLFSVIFARQTRWVTVLYGADLLGGALACLALVPIVNAAGASNAVLFAAVAVALAGATWVGGVGRAASLGLVTLLLVVIALNSHDQLFDIVYAKGYRRQQPLYAKWNAISRIEVDQRPGFKSIVIDAGASTTIMNTDLREWNPEHTHRSIMTAAPALANVLRPHGDFAIIGPGGGVDVLRAVANGSPNVTGIEINPIIATDIMRGSFADYAHHLYELPEVHIQVSDGRSFIRSSRNQYDVVQMTLVDTWASTAAGALALSENNLYTVEAFREYFEHLKPDGMIAITRWEFPEPREALRVVSEAMEALRQLGVTDSTGNFIVIGDGDPNRDGESALVLAKKSPFTEEEQRAVLEHMQESSPRNLHVLYMPATAKNPEMTHPVFAGLVRSQDARVFSKDYPYNIFPVGDDSPFFFLSSKPKQMLPGLGSFKSINLGATLLLAAFVVSVIAVVAFLVLPLALSPHARSGRSIRMLFFIAIGLGYILVEITLIQRFVLFLGHPTYALTVVLFLMLLSSSLGSLLSRRLFAQPTQVGWAILFVVAVLVAYVLGLPHLLAALVGLPFAVKLLLSALLVIPIGLPMGMPFPSGLRALSMRPSAPSIEGREPSTEKEGAVEWAWALNAASSVLGSVLAMLITIVLGLNLTLACGAAAYVLAILLLPTFSWA
jgi:spermidine synthase